MENADEIAKNQCRKIFKERIKQFARTPITPNEISEKMYCKVMEKILARILAGTAPFISDKVKQEAHTEIIKWRQEAKREIA